MRVFFGVIAGLLFLVFSISLIMILNLNSTFLNPNYVKNLADKSDLYNKIPQIISENISKEGNIPVEIQGMFIRTVTSAITPQIVKTHLESLIDQMLSNQAIINENISDIKDAVINDTDLGYLMNNSKDNFIPESITFDKSQNSFGKFVLQKNIYIWVSLIGTIGFLFILFFVSSRLLKSRLRWIGGFFTALTVIILTAFLLLRFINFTPLINMIKRENAMPQMLDQITVIISFVKDDFTKMFLYEFIILFIVSILSFVIAALIKNPTQNQGTGGKSETDN